PVDAVVAVVGEKGEDYKALLSEEGSSKEEKSEKTDESGDQDTQSDKEPAKEEKPVEAVEDKNGSAAEDGRTKASPLARKMASDEGIDISQLSGSGDGGRIIKKDVEKAIEKGVTAPSAPAAGTATLEIQS